MSDGEAAKDEAGATLHHIAVERSARYAQLGTAGPEVRELWFVLHGYRQLAPRFIRRFRPLVAPGRLIVAPEALNRFYVGDAPGRHGAETKVGGTWMTREDRETEIRDYVAYLDRLRRHLREELTSAGATDLRVVVLGFSQGAHTASRWAAYGQAPDDLVLWGEVLPHDLDLPRAAAAWRATRLLSVQGREDAYLGEAQLARQEAQVQEMGVELPIQWHDGGHVLTTTALAEVAAWVRTPR